MCQIDTVSADDIGRSSTAAAKEVLFTVFGALNGS